MNGSSDPRKPPDLSAEYWSRLSARDRQLYALVRPQAKAAYEVDVHLRSIESFVEGQTEDLRSMGGDLDLEPDFQRGHVWTESQQAKYVEALLRGCAPRMIMFNCPGRSRNGEEGNIRSHLMQCIDGLQRFTAVRRFMRGDVRVFGGLSRTDLVGSPFDPSRYTLQIAVFEFSHREDLLQFYLDLNSGGTVHSQEELDRVRALLSEARTGHR